ncbi:MAG: DUF4267 domain-containing protein [Kouleothrix sp.]
MATSSISKSAATQAKPAWRSVGVWLSIVLITFILFSAVRALLAPASFAATFGLPSADAVQNGFIAVYGIRSLFLSLFALGLLIQRQFAMLARFMLIATIIPIGDALLVAQRGGPTPIVIQHSATAGILLLTWFLLRRWAERSGA